MTDTPIWDAIMNAPHPKMPDVWPVEAIKIFKHSTVLRLASADQRRVPKKETPK